MSDDTMNPTQYSMYDPTAYLAKISQLEITLRGKTAESDRWYRLYCEQEKKIRELEFRCSGLQRRIDELDHALSVARSGSL